MDEQQMQRGRDAYRQMANSCGQLVASGNWQRVGASDIKLFLDMYVQALLLKLAQAGGGPSEDLLRFIAQVPGRDVLSLSLIHISSVINMGISSRLWPTAWQSWA